MIDFMFFKSISTSNNNKKFQIDPSIIYEHSFPEFVFGTTDSKQIAINDSLLYHVNIRNKQRNLQLYKNHFNINNYRHSNHKPLRKAKRTSVFVKDSYHNHLPICLLCNEHNSCILLKPCNHVGMCNTCSMHLYNKSIHKTTKNTFIVSELFPDPRFINMSNNDTLENDLYKIQLSLQLCPWCKTKVNHVEYIYVL